MNRFIPSFLPAAALSVVLGFGLGCGLVACGPAKTDSAVVPLEIDRSTSCELDGMLLADYPGPKAQIHYVGQDKPSDFAPFSKTR